MTIIINCIFFCKLIDMNNNINKHKIYFKKKFVDINNNNVLVFI